MSDLDEIIKKLENLDIYSNSINLDLEAILKDAYYSYPEIKDFEITGSNLKSFYLNENEGDIYFVDKNEDEISLRSLKDYDLRKLFSNILTIFEGFKIKNESK